MRSSSSSRLVGPSGAGVGTEAGDADVVGCGGAGDGVGIEAGEGIVVGNVAGVDLEGVGARDALTGSGEAAALELAATLTLEAVDTVRVSVRDACALLVSPGVGVGPGRAEDVKVEAEADGLREADGEGATLRVEAEEVTLGGVEG